MLNMEKTGRKISELRKKCNMTQLELADRLNISYQAVSNWECGKSMPDIVKLPELAEIFGVTLDELLGERAEIVECAVKGDSKGMLENFRDLRELANIAPLLKPAQMNEMINNVKSDSLADIDGIIPFIDEEVLNELAKKRIREGKSIAELLPFLDEDIVSEYAKMRYEKGGLHALDDVFPFMPEEQLMEMAKEEYEKRGIKGLDTAAPFLDEEWLNEIAKEAIEREGIRAISSIAPFLDSKMLSKYVKEKYL